MLKNGGHRVRLTDSEGSTRLRRRRHSNHPDIQIDEYMQVSEYGKVESPFTTNEYEGTSDISFPSGDRSGAGIIGVAS